MLTFESSQRLANGAVGWTKGIYPTTLAGTEGYVFNHEMVHVIQSMQLSCVSPYEPLIRDQGKTPVVSPRFFHFEGFKVDLLSLAGDLSYMAASYDHTWQEIEAYHFASGE
jgi:hypothetical protein